MNKGELVDAVADKSGLTKKDSEKAVAAIVDSIKAALSAGEKVSMVGFGTFEVRPRAARSGRNPQNGLTIKIPAGKTPAFRPGKELKESI